MIALMWWALAVFAAVFVTGGFFALRAILREKSDPDDGDLPDLGQMPPQIAHEPSPFDVWRPPQFPHDDLNGPLVVAEPQTRAGITPFPSRERLDGPAATTRTSPAAMGAPPLSSPQDADYTGAKPGAAAAAEDRAPAPPPLPDPDTAEAAAIAAGRPWAVPFELWESDTFVQALNAIKGGA